MEADSSTLPPVYVEDEAGFEEDAEDLDIESFGSVPVEDRFGAVCRYGFVGGQPRRGARKAAHRSVLDAKTTLGSVKPGGRPAPFVEDPNARPVLYSDGKIVEPVYGALCPVPCPSCTRTTDADAAKGASQTCVVCEQYGVILVPKDDIRTYVSSPHYGFLPLLTLAARPIVNAAVKGKLFPRAWENVKAWFKKTKDEGDDGGVESDVEDDASSEDEERSSVRALVPSKEI
jgi:hypothetical protein